MLKVKKTLKLGILFVCLILIFMQNAVAGSFFNFFKNKKVVYGFLAAGATLSIAYFLNKIINKNLENKKENLRLERLRLEREESLRIERQRAEREERIREEKEAKIKKYQDDKRLFLEKVKEVFDRYSSLACNVNIFYNNPALREAIFETIAVYPMILEARSNPEMERLLDLHDKKSFFAQWLNTYVFSYEENKFLSEASSILEFEKRSFFLREKQILKKYLFEMFEREGFDEAKAISVLSFSRCTRSSTLYEGAIPLDVEVPVELQTEERSFLIKCFERQGLDKTGFRYVVTPLAPYSYTDAGIKLIVLRPSCYEMSKMVMAHEVHHYKKYIEFSLLMGLSPDVKTRIGIHPDDGGYNQLSRLEEEECVIIPALEDKEVFQQFLVSFNTFLFVDNVTNKLHPINYYIRTRLKNLEREMEVVERGSGVGVIPCVQRCKDKLEAFWV